MAHGYMCILVFILLMALTGWTGEQSEEVKQRVLYQLALSGESRSFTHAFLKKKQPNECWFALGGHYFSFSFDDLMFHDFEYNNNKFHD